MWIQYSLGMKYFCFTVFTLSPFGLYGIVVSCVVCPFVRPTLVPLYTILRILFIFGTVIDLSRNMNSVDCGVSLIIFSCDQAALQMVFSVRLSVCPSVRLSVTPFWLCSHHRIIMKFSGVITSDRSDVHAKGQGQRSKVKVTEVTTQLYRFRTVTPVWIHVWWWNDAYSLIMLRRGALLFFKVICQISRSHGSKNRRIWPRLGDSGL